MPRPVNVAIPDKQLEEIEILAPILGRSFSTAFIKMLKLGIEAAKTMSIEDINGSKEDVRSIEKH